MRLFIFISVLVFLLWGCSPRQDGQQRFDNSRIVSFAPATTETLFAIGLGKNVVGVSKFCTYPPEVVSLPKVGGLIDPDIEGVVALKPTCVVLQRSGADIGHRLEALDLPVLYVDGNTLDEVLDSFEIIGNALGRNAEGKALKDNTLKALAPSKPTVSKQRILMVIWRDVGSGIQSLTVASNDGYFSRLVESLGCELVPEKAIAAFPTLNAESIIQLNPDRIIELRHDLDESQIEAAIADWRRTLPDLPAVRDNHISIITDQCAVVPGPRIPQFVELLKKTLLETQGL
ncbi:MAG: ABC transporter substrate-binding protein [Victivallales bacterium]|nr:ABC transporter substrate-binding protein [Victivallales bacterium]